MCQAQLKVDETSVESGSNERIAREDNAAVKKNEGLCVPSGNLCRHGNQWINSSQLTPISRNDANGLVVAVLVCVIRGICG
jgi:hypothetical protein